MSRTWVLCVLAASSIAVPVVLGDTSPAQGAKGPDQTAKAKDTPQDKGKDDAPTPTSPVPAPAPSGEAKAKDKDKPKGKGAPTSAAPAPTAVPGTPAAPAAPGASASPAVALDTPSLTPTLGRSVGVAAAEGTVKVRTAGDRDVRTLAAATAIPTGARVDARAGTVELSTAVGPTGTPQTATFHGAIFVVRQDAAAGGLTRITLRGGDFSGCRAVAGKAVAAKRRKPIRSLWGHDDHGRFQTIGKGTVGTVRGTRWLTQDFCDGTLTRVTEGSVAVRDLRRHRTVIVRAGHRSFARS